MTFEEAFDDMSFATTMTYLSKMENQSEEYRALDEESLQIYNRLSESLADGELLERYEELETAKGDLDLKWVYQKALYDCGVLLSKLGILLPDILMKGEITEEIEVSKETYEVLKRIAEKRNIPISLLTKKCVERAMEHPEEIVKALKTGGQRSEPAAQR